MHATMLDMWSRAPRALSMQLNLVACYMRERNRPVFAMPWCCLNSNIITRTKSKSAGRFAAAQRPHHRHVISFFFRSVLALSLIHI